MIDRGYIRERLRGLSERAAAAVAVRAAMRVLPALARRPKGDARPFAYWREGQAADHSLAVLRCYQVSIFGNCWPKIDAAVFAASSNAAARAAASADAANASLRSGSFAAASSSADAAAFAAAAATADPGTTSAAARAASSADTAAFAAFNVSASTASDALLSEIEALGRTAEFAWVLALPLWPDGAPGGG